MWAVIEQATSGGSQWPPGAIHDTVAAIVRQPAYAQNVVQSLLGRIVQFVLRRIGDLFRFFDQTPGARPIVIGITIVLVLAIAARIAIAGRVREIQRRAGISSGRRVPMTDPLDTARSLAAQGMHTDAAHALYIALLQRLAARGWIRLHSSKTGGDYARELRAKGLPAHASFRSFSTRFDRVIFGAGTCDAEEFSELMRRAEALLVEQRAA